MSVNNAETEAEIFFRNARGFARPDGCVPALASQAAAYEVQRKVFQPGKNPTVWKLGGVNKATRSAFNFNATYAGPISGDAIFPLCAKMQPADFGRQCQAELELLVRLDELHVSDVSDRALVDAKFNVAPALECPATVLNFPQDGVLALIADCCAAGTLVHGPWQQYNLTDLGKLQGAVSLSTDATVLTEGSYAQLIDGLAGCVASFLTLAQTFDCPVRAGDLVSTGGLTPCVKLPLNTGLRAIFPGFDDLNFEIAGSPGV